MAGDLSDQELGKRLSAGRGYVRESLSQFAERLDVDRHELTKWELGDFGSPERRRVTARKREQAISLVHQASGLPTEFFKINLDDLPAMVRTWRQLDEEDAQEAERAAGEIGRVVDQELATEEERKRGKA